MRNNFWLLPLALVLATPVFCETPGEPATLLARTNAQTHAVVLDVLFSGDAPDAHGPYADASKWTVLWKARGEERWKSATVARVSVGENSVSLTLSPLEGAGLLPGAVDWNVSFSAPGLKTSTVDLNARSADEDKKSCRKDSVHRPPFCPVGQEGTPDLEVNGAFLAGGGTSPLYSFELKGGVFFPRVRDKATGIPTSNFQMGVNTQVEINKNTTPPVQRTRFDPDSITAGFALTDMVTFERAQGGAPLLVGMRFQAQLPAGEFNRDDPSSNIIGSGLTTFDLKPWHPVVHPSLYATLYPFVGVEAGRNLNRPTSIDAVPVDLSHYKGIVRGYTGADAAFVKVSEDREYNVFSLSGTYRARIPGIAEPLVKTLHGVTDVEMTTKTRHWVETNLDYTVPAWKYLALNAKYQYGELPPLFPFVDHKVSVGFTLQFSQSGKAVGSKLVQ